VDIPAQERGVLRPTEEAPKDTAPYSAEANSVSEADAAGRAEDLPRARGRHATKETVAERQAHQTAEIAQLLTPNIPANLPGASAPEIQDGKISSIQAQPEPAPFAAIPDSEQADAPIGSMAPPIKGKAPRPLSSKADAGPVKAPLDNLPATGSKLANPSDSRSPTRNDASAAASDDGSAAKSTADRPDRPVRSAGAPPENLAKNEPIPPAANGPQMSPQPPAGPHHALPDSPAVPNLPATPAAPNDPGAAVKLAFSGPSSALSETPSFDALALKIATRSADGDRNFSIRLDPPELGRIEVHLNVNSDGHAEAELRADRPQTLELLQKDASQLERALKDAGLNLAGSLAFSLKGEGKSGAWRDGQNSQRGRVLQIGAADAASANAALAGSAALAAQAYGLSTARLDIRV
jgi:chemotaxis protein MotD